MGNPTTANSVADAAYGLLDQLGQMTTAREADGPEYTTGLAALREAIGTLCTMARTATRQSDQDQVAAAIATHQFQDALYLLALMPEVRDSLQITDTAHFGPTGRPTTTRRTYNLTAGVFSGTITFFGDSEQRPPRLVVSNSKTGLKDQVVELDWLGLTVAGLPVLLSAFGKHLTRATTPKRLYEQFWDDTMSVNDLPEWLRAMLLDEFDGDLDGVTVTRSGGYAVITRFGRPVNIPSAAW